MLYFERDKGEAKGKYPADDVCEPPAGHDGIVFDVHSLNVDAVGVPGPPACVMLDVVGGVEDAG